MREVERQLAVDETAVRQAERRNGVLRQLVGATDQGLQAELVLPPRVVHGMKARSPLGDPVDLPALPATPFSQSDLLVNADGQPNMAICPQSAYPGGDGTDLHRGSQDPVNCSSNSSPATSSSSMRVLVAMVGVG
jgi:hypothetical protein